MPTVRTLKTGISGVRGVVGDSLTPYLLTSFAEAFGTYLGGGEVAGHPPEDPDADGGLLEDPGLHEFLGDLEGGGEVLLDPVVVFPGYLFLLGSPEPVGCDGLPEVLGDSLGVFGVRLLFYFDLDLGDYLGAHGIIQKYRGFILFRIFLTGGGSSL